MNEVRIPIPIEWLEFQSYQHPSDVNAIFAKISNIRTPKPIPIEVLATIRIDGGMMEEYELFVSTCPTLEFVFDNEHDALIFKLTYL